MVSTIIACAHVHLPKQPILHIAAGIHALRRYQQLVLCMVVLQEDADVPWRMGMEGCPSKFCMPRQCRKLHAMP